MWPFSSKSTAPAEPSPQPRKVIRIVETELGSLTLQQWVSDKGLTSQAHGALTSPLLRRMLQVLHNSHPAFQVMTNGDVTERALHQKMCEGYTTALADLESMGVHIPTVENIASDFEAEEVDPKLVEEYSSKGKKTA